MKLKIGVMGSASGRLAASIKRTAYPVGKSIAEADCITVTGACPGYPFEAPLLLPYGGVVAESEIGRYGGPSNTGTQVRDTFSDLAA